jgi:DNA primase
VLDGSQPKYLNTAETPVFHKSHVVYGLDRAHTAIRDAGKVVIVEGYMDVIAAHQFGFANVVACMGTALTPDQLQQLQRYTSNFVLALDADAAGQQATIRGLNQARQALSRVRKPTPTAGGMRLEERLGAALYIAAMPDGRDPDDVIRSDPAAWQTLVDQAKPLVDFYFSVVARETDLTTAQGKGAAVAELAPLIAELDDEIEREHYVQQLSRLVQLDERTIAGRVQAAAKTGKVATNRPLVRKGRPMPRRRAPGGSLDGPPADLTFGEPPPESPDDGLPELVDIPAAPSATKPKLSSEDYLLAHLLREPDLLIWLANAVIEREIAPVDWQDWQHTENQEIFRALKRLFSSHVPWDLESFQESLPGVLHGRLAYLIAVGTELPPRDSDELRIDLVKVLVRVRLDRLKEHSIRLKYLMDEMTQSGGGRDDSLGAQHNQVLRDLAHLQSTYYQLSRVLASQERAGQGLLIR